MTEYVVWCETHRDYLRRASVGGTTWTADADEACRYLTKPAARKAADLATWLDHRPTPWAVADRDAEV